MTEKNRLFKNIKSMSDKKRLGFDNLGIIVALIMICFIISMISPVFLSWDNMLSIGRQISTNMMMALGMSLVIILGGIDLSVGSTVALSGTLCVGFINAGVPIPLAALIAILVGVCIGALNGVLITYTGIAPFIVSMCSMNIIRGTAYIYTGGLPVRAFDESFATIGNGYLGPIPLPVIYILVFIIIVSLILTRTKFGTYIYALGGNREAAKFSGIPIHKIEIIVYTISGFFCAIAGVVLSARMYSGQPSAQSGGELDAIAACVLGGVSMTGGLGNIGGVVIGAFIIGIINNGLNLMNTNSFWQLIVKGVIVLVAVYIDTLKRKKADG